MDGLCLPRAGELRPLAPPRGAIEGDTASKRIIRTWITKIAINGLYSYYSVVQHKMSSTRNEWILTRGMNLYLLIN